MQIQDHKAPSPDQQVINHLKGLVIDGVNQAQSGHVGGAMSSMDFAYLLWTEYLKFNPDDPNWLGRDRFILSAGHESMLLYSFAFANGWLPLSELKAFRQLGSKTPGHPEFGITPGVECTSGPLGQGAGMSVGIAIAQKHFGAIYDAHLFSQKTWALLGDGCIQEDITYGAASLAGHLGLNNLIWFYDKNRKQIAGDINRCYSDDTAKLFEAMGWNVITVDGHDRQALRQAMDRALKAQAPTLIIGNTVMAKGGATCEDDHDTHGVPLKAAEYAATRQKLGLPEEPFYWPDNIATHYRRNFEQLKNQVKTWQAHFSDWQSSHVAKAEMLKAALENKLPKLPRSTWSDGLATRQSFGKLLEAWQGLIPQMMGGSADLDPSTMTEAFAKAVGDFTSENPQGRNLAFGVREFPMSAIANGLALHGGIIPFDSTFLTFSDYARPALRLGAIQGLRVIHEYTHDSFYLGEDGPTHQPVEHVASLRAMPDLYVVRPADSIECEAYFGLALQWKKPSAFCLSRQKLPLLSQLNTNLGDYFSTCQKGAYIAWQHGKSVDVIFFASGSEVSLAIECAKDLSQKFAGVRVVSVPCWEAFFEQDDSYKNMILARECKLRVSIEAGATFGWERFVGMDGIMVGLDRYGESGKAGDLAKHFGFGKEAICARVLARV